MFWVSDDGQQAIYRQRDQEGSGPGYRESKVSPDLGGGAPIICRLEVVVGAALLLGGGAEVADLADD